MTRIYLSHFLGHDTPFYGGDGRFEIEQLRSMDNGDSCNAVRWSFPNHAGTHVDLPRHFVRDGKCLTDYLPATWFFTKIAIVDISDVMPGSVIGPEMLDNCRAASSTELLLLKTGYGRLRETQTYWRENPIFRPDLADYLRDKFPNIRAIGFDSISVSSWMDRSTGREAHRAFLSGEHPILLIEDMNLLNIDSKTLISNVTIAPLLVKDADASPCMVVAEVAE